MPSLLYKTINWVGDGLELPIQLGSELLLTLSKCSSSYGPSNVPYHPFSISSNLQAIECATLGTPSKQTFWVLYVFLSISTYSNIHIKYTGREFKPFAQTLKSKIAPYHLRHDCTNKLMIGWRGLKRGVFQWRELW